MGKVGIYDFERRLEQAMDKLRNDDIGKGNIRDIVSFSEVKLAKGVSSGRAAKIIHCLRLLAKRLRTTSYPSLLSRDLF